MLMRASILIFEKIRISSVKQQSSIDTTTLATSKVEIPEILKLIPIPFAATYGTLQDVSRRNDPLCHCELNP
jgi:hypothetical protein